MRYVLIFDFPGYRQLKRYYDTLEGAKRGLRYFRGKYDCDLYIVARW